MQKSTVFVLYTELESLFLHIIYILNEKMITINLLIINIILILISSLNRILNI